jgi:phage tail sheath protein FI
MAEATVTVKLTPAEFDLTREAITTAHDQAKKDGVDQTLTADVRQKIRAKQLLLRNLGAKLSA